MSVLLACIETLSKGYVFRGQGQIVIESRSLGTSRVKRTVVETSPEDERFYQGVREILAELPKSDDPIIITLKAHLVIERFLIQIVESVVPNPAPLKDLNRLQFSTRLALAESLAPPVREIGRSIWPLARKLGKIRNDIAHQLRPHKLEEDIEAFLGLYIRFFGARVRPPIHPAHRSIVTADNFLIPENVRSDSAIEKYRNALAGTAQGFAATLATLRASARDSRPTKPPRKASVKGGKGAL
jgi:hypothetical protein